MPLRVEKSRARHSKSTHGADSRKPDHRSRKTNRSTGCHRRALGLLFPARRRGNPVAGPDAGHDVAKAASGPGCGLPGATGKPRAPGTVGRSDGDPSGSSSGSPSGEPSGSQDLLGDEERRSSDRQRSSDRTSPGASATGKTPIGVGSPARQRLGESPERVEASAKAPSGLSRFRSDWAGRPIHRHGRPPPDAAGTLRSVACLHALPREAAQPG
jgi:hypothetical protein